MDVKIYAKAIAQRLLDIIPSIIHPAQVGFVKESQTLDYTRPMLKILRYVDVFHKIPTLFLARDAKKAFDQVHWEFLEASLHKFGFAGSILPAIMAL